MNVAVQRLGKRTGLDITEVPRFDGSAEREPERLTVEKDGDRWTLFGLECLICVSAKIALENVLFTAWVIRIYKYLYV